MCLSRTALEICRLLQHLYFGQLWRRWVLSVSTRSSLCISEHTTCKQRLVCTHTYRHKQKTQILTPPLQPYLHPPPSTLILFLLPSLAMEMKAGHSERMVRRNEDVSDFHSNQWGRGAPHSLPSDRSLSTLFISGPISFPLIPLPKHNTGQSWDEAEGLGRDEGAEAWKERGM